VSTLLQAGQYCVEIYTSTSYQGLDQPYSFALKRGGYIQESRIYGNLKNVNAKLYTTLSTVSSVSVGGTTLVADRDYTATPKTITSAGKYTVTVTGKAPNFYGSHSYVLTVYPDYPMISTAKSKILGKGKVKIAWYKVAGVSNYTVYYKKSGTSKWKTKTVKASKSSVTISKLTKKKKYYFKVIAYKAQGSKKYYSAGPLTYDSTYSTYRVPEKRFSSTVKGKIR
jgi:hypothetical protein